MDVPAVGGPIGTGPIGTGPIGSGPIGTGPIGSGPIGSGPIGTGDVDIDVHSEDGLGELPGGGHDGAVSVHHEGAAVENKLILAADLVHISDSAMRLGHPLPGHVQTLLFAADGVGGGVHIHDQQGAACGLGGDRTAGEPQVLTHRHAHRDARHLEELQFRRPRGEPPFLVEDAVVGEPALVVHAEHVPAGAHGQSVAQAPRRAPDGGFPGHHTGPIGPGHGIGNAVGSHDVHESHQCHAAPSGRGHSSESHKVVGHEGRFEQKVFGRVAGDRQLGKGGQVGAVLFGPAERRQNLVDIAVYVADHRVDLAQSHAQASHEAILPGPTGTSRRSTGPGMLRSCAVRSPGVCPRV